MADRVGQRLGNYQLIRLLGEGGFAEVYLGEHIHLGTQAAVKVLHTQLTSDDVDKFRTEARTIAHLIHPHIVRVLEFGVEDKTPFLVIDYAPNGSLRQCHPKGTLLPLDTIISYVKQVAEALQYAHEEKVIHRDIKPENMLLGRRNELLLSDFGIALVVQSSRYQSTHEMAGTMAYMAPEQIQGKPRPASDQYSLGIVVYEWISGDRPFHGSLSELVGQHLSVSPPSLQEKVPTIPPIIERIVLTTLAKDPKERYSSIQAFAIALEKASLSPPIALPSEPTSPSQSLSVSNAALEVSLNQLPQSMNAVTPPSQSLEPTVEALPFNTLDKLPNSMKESIISEKAQPSVLLHSAPEELLGTALPLIAKSLNPSIPASPISESLNIPTKARPTAPLESHRAPASRSNTTTIGHRSLKNKAVLLIGLALLIILSSGGLFSFIRINQTAADYARATVLAATSIAQANATVLAATSTAQANATANAVATATTVAMNRDPYPPYTGQLVLNDSLSDNSNGDQWEEYSNNTGSCQFVQGAYHVTMPQDFGGSCFAQATDFTNFAYQVQMTFVKGEYNNIVGGIVFRGGTNGNCYDFFIYGDGRYFFDVLVGNVGNLVGQSTYGATKAFHIGLNQPNIIAVVANGNTFNIYVNGQRIVGPVSDNHFSHGMIGVNGTSYQSTSEIAFSNVKVWKL